MAEGRLLCSARQSSPRLPHTTNHVKRSSSKAARKPLTPHYQAVLYSTVKHSTPAIEIRIHSVINSLSGSVEVALTKLRLSDRARNPTACTAPSRCRDYHADVMAQRKIGIWVGPPARPPNFSKKILALCKSSAYNLQYRSTPHKSPPAQPFDLPAEKPHREQHAC